MLGWSWLFPPYCWHFDAVAEEDTDAISFPAARLRDDCEADKAYGYAVMKQVAELLIHRLQATRLKLVQAHKRLAARAHRTSCPRATNPLRGAPHGSPRNS